MINKLKLTSFLLFASVLLIFNCSSSDDNSSPTNGESFMRANIGEDYWESTSISQSFLTQYTAQEAQRYDVQGVSEQYKVNIAVAQYTLAECMSPGTYSGDDVLLFFYHLLPNGVYLSEHYPSPIDDDTIEEDIEVIITNCSNGTISGTFSGTLYKGSGNDVESVAITSGEFQNIEFITQSF